MFSNWMKFSLSTARLGYEVQTVMALRMLKLARGGKAAETEARRMVAEKGVAFAEAAATLATGGSMNKVVRRVRSRVSKNKRRLSRSYAHNAGQFEGCRPKPTALAALAGWRSYSRVVLPRPGQYPGGVHVVRLMGSLSRRSSVLLAACSCLRCF